MVVGAEGSVGLVAVAEAPQVRREQIVAIGEPRHHRLPGEPEFGPAMQQQKRLPCPRPRDMEGGAISPNRQVLHRDSSFSCSVFVHRDGCGMDSAQARVSRMPETPERCLGSDRLIWFCLRSAGKTRRKRTRIEVDRSGNLDWL